MALKVCGGTITWERGVKMSKREFELWLDLVKEIVDKLPNVPPLLCPKCGQPKVVFQYVGDPETRIGYLDIWCKSCLYGIHISRTGIPENAHMISFKAPDEEIVKRIPNFIQVTPFG